MEYVKKNAGIITVLVSYLIAIIGAYFSLQSLTFDSREQKRHVIEHAQDLDVHMPMSEKMKIFVPRSELDVKFDAIMRQLSRIEKKLD